MLPMHLARQTQRDSQEYLQTIDTDVSYAERMTYAFLCVFSWHVDVHSPQTSDQVHRNEDCTKRSEFREDVVDLVVRVCHFDGDLGEVV